jgi:predicted ester cyclase
MIVADDMMITRWRSAATHKGEFQGSPPTGAAAEITGTTIARIASGKIAEERFLWIRRS